MIGKFGGQRGGFGVSQGYGVLVSSVNPLVVKKRPRVNPAEGGTSEGGRIDILGEGDEIIQSELQQVSGT